MNVTESTNINDEQIEVNLVDRLGLDNDTLSKFRVQTSADETSIVVMEYVLKDGRQQKMRQMNLLENTGVSEKN